MKNILTVRKLRDIPHTGEFGYLSRVYLLGTQMTGWVSWVRKTIGKMLHFFNSMSGESSKAEELHKKERGSLLIQC